MAKTKIRMQVRSQEVWGSSGQVIESVNLGIPENGSDTYAVPDGGIMPRHNISLYFPEGEGFKAFPMGAEVDVTFSPVEGDG